MRQRSYAVIVCLLFINFIAIDYYIFRRRKADIIEYGTVKYMQTTNVAVTVEIIRSFNTTVEPNEFKSTKAVKQKNENTVLDTCPLSVIDPLSPELLQFHTPNYNPKKGCKVYKPMTSLENGVIRVVSRNASCRARCILHKNDNVYAAAEFFKVPSNNTFECDVIETECEQGNNTESYLHLQIYENKAGNAKKKHLPNVYLLILDSVSTFMAKRSLPKTIDFLKTEMGGVQMEFLNKVGDNSRPNGFPFTFGKSIEKISRVGRPAEAPDWDNFKICHEWMDDYPHYLEEFRKKGYKTMIGQDYSMGIIFYQVCKGVRRREADHLYRPFDLRMWSSYNISKNLVHATCGESHIYMLEYYEKFMNSYAGVPKIAQSWPTGLVHDGMASLYHADDHFLSFFRRNREKLDGSFLIFTADHGPRANGIEQVRLGRYENRNPFLLVILPKNLRGTAMHQQLREKALQLMTHFDLHATFMDILHYQPQANFMDSSYRNMQPYSKGSSLLRSWKDPRNCNTLPIPFDYCLCQYKKENVTDESVKTKLGAFVAEQLNLHLNETGYGDKCYKQYYNKTMDAQQLRVGTNMLYSVFVKLMPSEGFFSAEILDTPSGFVLSSHFARWGWYGTQGDCVLDPPRPICHCIKK